jgi:glycosyltransferase involved in cell wall biosynthesis
MRVLHVHSGNLFGGVETLLRTFATHQHLCATMEPHYALCFAGRLSEELNAAGAPVHLLGEVRVRQPLTVLRARRMLSELLQRETYDLVVFHSTWSLSLFGPVVQSQELPLVFWLHNPTDGRHWLDRWGRRTVPDLVLCNSRFTAGSLSNIFPRVPAEVVYCPVALPSREFSNTDRLETRRQLQTPDEAIVIIQASRMEAWKGHALHLEALGLLKDFGGWICWQVGGGQRPDEIEYLEGLKVKAEQLGIADRIRFLGERSDVPKLLAAADIHCQPNTGPEPFGLTFVEALAAGRPVVTTALGGALEIVDGTCGLLVQPKDPKALAEALLHLIQDQTLREKLGNAGPARVRKICDVETQMQRLYECFSGVSREQLERQPVNA